MSKPVDVDRIPAELRDWPHWVVWRYETREGKRTKVPYSPTTRRRASSTDPATWAPFLAALAVFEAGGYEGIGFVVTDETPFTGVDLDKCIDDAGQVDPWAWQIVTDLDSYTEVTPSGRGLRVWLRGKLPPGTRRQGQVEMYDAGRYFTVTGWHVKGTPTVIKDRAAVLPLFYEEIFSPPADPPPPPATPPQPVTLDDLAIIDKAHGARNRAIFAALWRGDVTIYGGDESRADYHLCRHLAFWTGKDPARIDRLFRQSGLYREKWDNRHAADGRTYGEMTIGAALDATPNSYTAPTPRPARPTSNGHPAGLRGHAPAEAAVAVAEEMPAMSQPTAPVVADGLPAAPVSPESHETRETRRRFQLLHADELDNLPPVKWLIKDEVAAGQFSLFYGPSGGGKSFVALDWALQVAQDHPVLYVAAEDAQGYAARKIAWRLHHGKPAGQLYFMPEPVNLFDPADVTAFIDDVARPMRPALIVFDTLARCMTGADENSARDMGVVVDHIEAIRHATGAACIPVHHSNKTGGTYRGSSALFGAAYTVIELQKDDDLIIVKSEKAKNSANFAPRVLRLIQVSTGRETAEGEPETSCVAVPSDKVYTRGPELTERQRVLLDTLAMAVFVEAGAKSATLQETLSIPKPSLYRTLSDLMRKGYVRQATKGDPYYITNEGLTAIGANPLDLPAPAAAPPAAPPVSPQSHETRETTDPPPPAPVSAEWDTIRSGTEEKEPFSGPNGRQNGRNNGLVSQSQGSLTQSHETT